MPKLCWSIPIQRVCLDRGTGILGVRVPQRFSPATGVFDDAWRATAVKSEDPG